MYYLLHASNQKTNQDYGLIVLAAIQSHSLSQRQGISFPMYFPILFGTFLPWGHIRQEREI